MVPGEFLLLDSLPLTPNKKLDRKALASLRPPSKVSDQQKAAVRSGLESDLSRVWEQVLGQSSFGADDNFFDVGGNSFLAMRLHHRLRDGLAPGLSLTDVFRYPTIRLLADHLGRRTASNETVKKAVDRGQARRQRRAGHRIRRKDRSS
jgi:hypothetical protein